MEVDLTTWAADAAPILTYVGGALGAVVIFGVARKVIPMAVKLFKRA